MLGDQCPFDHGVDPVIIGNSIPTYPAPPPLLGIPSLPLTKPGQLFACMNVQVRAGQNAAVLHAVIMC